MNWNDQLYPDHYLVTHDVSPADNGLRLDQFLKARFPKRSRQKIQGDITSGQITIERPNPEKSPLGRLRPSTTVLAGDQIVLLSERKSEPEVDFNYQTLFEDDELLVVNKPANLPVHPAGKFFFNTLVTHLKTQGFTQPLDQDHNYYLVHRIDRETSGVMVICRKREYCENLIQQFAQRKTRKSYLAIVHGVPQQKSFEINAPMDRDPNSKIRLKMGIFEEGQGGQTAVTEVQVLESLQSGKYSLLECFPKTGRQHQIRLHLAHVGYPIVGDKLYGLPEEIALGFYDDRYTVQPLNKGDPLGREIPAEIRERLILNRHALHAHRLSFFHPRTGHAMEFSAPLTPDLEEFTAPQRRATLASSNNALKSLNL